MNTFRTPLAKRHRQARRRGAALYVSVLATALITSLLGLAGIALVRIERKEASISNDLLDARMNARAAVELALRVLANDPDWRDTYTSGVETTPQSLGANGNGTVSWMLQDSDGDLRDEDEELRVHGIGRVGTTGQVSSLEIKASPCDVGYLDPARVTVVPGTWLREAAPRAD